MCIHMPQIFSRQSRSLYIDLDIMSISTYSPTGIAHSPRQECGATEIVVLDVFMKKTDRTEKARIELCQARLRAYMDVR